MTREQLIERALNTLSKLPDSKVLEVADFADEILKRIEDQHLSVGIAAMAAESRAFGFLAEEEDIYSVNDLKDRYK